MIASCNLQAVDADGNVFPPFSAVQYSIYCRSMQARNSQLWKKTLCDKINHKVHKTKMAFETWSCLSQGKVLSSQAQRMFAHQKKLKVMSLVCQVPAKVKTDEWESDI